MAATQASVIPAFLDDLQARAVLVLWRGGHGFDTLDIARLLDIEEHQVCRIVQAARDFEREAGNHG